MSYLIARISRVNAKPQNVNFLDKILHKNDIKIYEQTVTLHEIFDFFKKIEKIVSKKRVFLECI